MYVEVSTADITAPSFVNVNSSCTHDCAVYPRVPWNTTSTDITGDQVTLDVAMDEIGYIYYVIVPPTFTYNGAYTDGSARKLPTVTSPIRLNLRILSTRWHGGRGPG